MAIVYIALDEITIRDLPSIRSSRLENITEIWLIVVKMERDIIIIKITFSENIVEPELFFFNPLSLIFKDILIILMLSHDSHFLDYIALS